MRAQRPRLSSRGLAACAVLAAAAGGCDWRTFDDLKADAPVLAAGPDNHFGATGDFGRYVLPLSGPATGATGGRFLVSAASTACIGIVDVAATGSASSRSLCSAAFGSTTPLFPITSMAEIPGTHDVLLGAPLAGGPGTVYVMTLGASFDATVFDSPDGEDHFGLGVGAGDFAGTPDPDYVVVSQSQITVYLDGDQTKPAIGPVPPPACPLEISTALPMRERLNRAVLVAPLAGPGFSKIIVGTPAPTGDMGAVSVFDVDPVTGTPVCGFGYRSPEARFGHALAIGDFDADGTPDLLVAAPPGKAYWIKGPLRPDSALQPVKLAPGSSDLGSTVGAANLDGKPGDEALVGDPGASFDGKMGAGEVRIVTSSSPSGGMVLDKELPVLRRHDPAAVDGFGVQAGALPFCTAGCGTASPTMRDLALVGALARTYAYFQLFPGDKDPRKP